MGRIESHDPASAFLGADIEAGAEKAVRFDAEVALAVILEKVGHSKTLLGSREEAALEAVTGVYNREIGMVPTEAVVQVENQ